ncbi:hypothetical protein HOG21_01060 [bacterium]|jgi:hypothetical protein|nr:hypothetical protein [bacterium]
MVSSESDEIKKNKKEIELLEAKVKKQGNVSFEKKVKREPKRVEKINVEPKEIVETVKENYVKIYT